MTKKALSKSDSFLLVSNLSFLTTTSRAQPGNVICSSYARVVRLEVLAKEALFLTSLVFSKPYVDILNTICFETLIKGTFNGKFPFSTARL